MYWPIGAPRIYAASNSRTDARRYEFEEGEDDAESRETTEGSGSLSNAPSVDGKGELEPEISPMPKTPRTPITPGISPVEDHDSQSPLSTENHRNGSHFSRSVERDPLLALNISRTGHLFAVITSTSLTIWQTKVWSYDPSRSKELNLFVANCYPGSCNPIE
jgi:hypothetical protein